jgi:hypothetical protein
MVTRMRLGGQIHNYQNYCFVPTNSYDRPTNVVEMFVDGFKQKACAEMHYRGIYV